MTVIATINHNLETKEDALLYVESLILKLLRKLISGSPRTIADIEERVKKTIPSPADQLVLNRAHSVIHDLFSNTKKKKNDKVLNNNSLITFPVHDVHTLLVKEVLGYKIEVQMTAFLLTVLEWVAADIFKLTGNYVNNCRQKHISRLDIRIAMNADHVLTDLFYGEDGEQADVETDTYMSRVLQSILSKDSGGGGGDGSQSCDANIQPTYDECVKELIHEEQQFIKDLNLIIKVRVAAHKRAAAQ